MKKWVKRSLVGAGALLLLTGVGAAGYGWHVYRTVEKTAVQIYEPIQPSTYVSKDPDIGQTAPEAKTQELISKKHPFTVLVMGVDQRENDRGRADSLIMLAVNPIKQSILMFNIPRDTRTEIIGHGTVDKINHAYAFGGTEMSKRTVEHFLDYPVDYYIKINMEGFSKLIDLMGGVTVDNSFAFDIDGYHYDKGTLKLSGDEALMYARMRYEDPRGDLGRNSRQRDILQQVMKKALNFNNIAQIQKLLNQLGTSVKTDVTFDEMKTFIADYRTDLKSFDSVEISGKGSTINGIWYSIVSKEEQDRIHNLLKEQMNVPEGAKGE
ncbi:LCP family protein [Paenibacillus sp. NPDC058071]|uniref:LCP family glycopolymer transferase n=1 Tax=Paenibacillus sp. NPDC058071 TaxID=3346326 RepID=UPI0036D964CD